MAALNVPFDVTVDANGVPKQFVGMDAVWQPSGKLARDEESIFREEVKQNFGEAWITDALSLIKADLPDSPVGIGRGWQISHKRTISAVPRLSAFTVNTTWTPSLIEEAGSDRIVLVDLEGESHRTYGEDEIRRADPDEQNLREVFVNATITGSLKWNLTSGMPLERTMKSAGGMGLTIQPVQGKKEIAQIDSETTVSLTIARGKYMPSTRPATR